MNKFIEYRNMLLSVTDTATGVWTGDGLVLFSTTTDAIKQIDKWYIDLEV
jgi:hypothetical protein